LGSGQREERDISVFWAFWARWRALMMIWWCAAVKMRFDGNGVAFFGAHCLELQFLPLTSHDGMRFRGSRARRRLEEEGGRQ
jgi:hypothetical protein